MDRKTLSTIIPHYRSFVEGVGKDPLQPIDNGQSSNVVYGIATTKKLEREKYHICFGHLDNYSHFYGRADPQALLLQFQTEMIDERIKPDLYYEWLFNYSPWREVFVTKNLSSLYKKRVIVIDTDQDANLMVGGAIAARHPWEQWAYWGPRIRNSVVLWQQLVEAGNDPDSSFVFANQIGFNPDDGKYYVVTDGLGHQSISSDCAYYPNIHANFVERKANPGHAYKKAKTYDHPAEYWDAPRSKKERLDWFIKNWLKGGEVASANPFKSTSGTQHFSLDQVLSVFKEAIPAYKTAIKEA